MNGFPYWQFHNERWLSGKVSALDLDAQGLFLHFCMKAWSEQGAFNICSSSVRLRFRKDAAWVADTVAAMVDVGILISDGSKYRIKFIEEQLQDMRDLREKKAKGGKASAEKRAAAGKEEESKQDKSRVLSCVEQVFNTCSARVEDDKPKTYKQWGFDDLLASVRENNADNLLTEDQAHDFAEFWTSEKDAAGKSRLWRQKTWSTRMRMKTAKTMIYSGTHKTRATSANSAATDEQGAPKLVM
jgi:hypothetical protein